MTTSFMIAKLAERSGEKIEVLDLAKLDQPYRCHIRLLDKSHWIRPKVTLRPDMVSNNLIYLGGTPSDECEIDWYRAEDVQILAVLGKAKQEVNYDS